MNIPSALSPRRLIAPALAVVAVAAAQVVSASPEIPGPPQDAPIAVVDGTIHTVSGPIIEQGTLVFDRGRITAVGRKVPVPRGAKKISARGRHVYPGLVNAYSNLGLVEIGAVRATADYRETGRINPNVKAEVAFNPDSELIPVTRNGGVLLSLTAPSGGLISGSSAVIQLDGWTCEDMTLKAPVGMHVQWPATARSARPGRSDTGKAESPPGDDEAMTLLERTFADARAYQKARTAAPDRHGHDARLQAMLPVLEGKLPLIVAADEVDQIRAAVAFAGRQNVKMILLGGYDAPDCAALLREHDVPVIVGGVYRLPRRVDDAYDAPFALPERLRAAGVRFCIAAGGRNASNSRNLPYHAAMAAAFGLPRDEALKAVTLYPAQILGIDRRVGSLEVGKDATLIITDGDPLETPTHVKAAFVQGRKVDLSDRQKRLWKKYREKQRRPTS